MSQNSGKGTHGRKWVPAQNATNYILCHIRKVVYKKNSSEDEEEKVSDKEHEEAKESADVED